MALPASATVLGRLAAMVQDPFRALPADMAGIAPLPPTAIAGAAPVARRRLAPVLARDCGLAALDVPDRFLRRIRTDEEERLAAGVAVLDLQGLRTAAQAVSAAVFASLALGLVRKEERRAFTAALGEEALTIATRLAPVFFARLPELAPQVASVAEALAPGAPVPATEFSPQTAAAPQDRWTRPRLSHAVAAEPLVLRTGYAVLTRWLERVEPVLGDLTRARLGSDVDSSDGAPVEDAHAAQIARLLKQRVPRWSSSTA